MPQAHGDRQLGLVNPLPIEEGVCYLVKGKSVEPAYRLLQYRVMEGAPVLCVSRLHPDRLRTKFGLASATVWWISESPGEGHFDPTAVGTLSSAVEAFIEDHPEGCLILLDGIEFIKINIGFVKTLLFVEHLNEYVMPRRATLLVSADPECFEPTEFALLDRFTGGIMASDIQEAVDTFEVDRDLAED